MEVRNWTVTSNPTIVDTDSDGLSDYEEFLNSSDPTKNDTDGDHILDADEEAGALTQIEGKDPEILKFSDGTQVHLKIEYVYDSIGHWLPVGLKLVATVKVRDNAGIDYVYIKISGQPGKKKYLENSPLEAEVKISFAFDWLRTLTVGFDVNVTVADVNGNGNCTETHIDGLIEGVIKALISAFWAFVEAVKEIASKVFDWIWDWIQGMIETVMKPIEEFIEGIMKKIVDSIYTVLDLNGYLEEEGKGRGDDDTIKGVNAFLSILACFLGGVTIVQGVLLAIAIYGKYVTGGLLTVLSDGVTELLKTQIARFIVGSVGLGASFLSAVLGLDFTPETVVDIIGNILGISTLVSVILAFVVLTYRFIQKRLSFTETFANFLLSLLGLIIVYCTNYVEGVPLWAKVILTMVMDGIGFTLGFEAVQKQLKGSSSIADKAMEMVAKIVYTIEEALVYVDFGLAITGTLLDGYDLWNEIMESGDGQ